MNEELGISMGVHQEVTSPATEWIPSRKECLRSHNINIEFLSMGCIVKVGCMSIPFQFINDAIDAIKAYTENPYEERQKWEKLTEEKNN
jgi:hypothetical protein